MGVVHDFAGIDALPRKSDAARVPGRAAACACTARAARLGKKRRNGRRRRGAAVRVSITNVHQ
eukprot:gene26874-31520_t